MSTPAGFALAAPAHLHPPPVAPESNWPSRDMIVSARPESPAAWASSPPNRSQLAGAHMPWSAESNVPGLDRTRPSQPRCRTPAARAGMVISLTGAVARMSCRTMIGSMNGAQSSVHHASRSRAVTSSVFVTEPFSCPPPTAQTISGVAVQAPATTQEGSGRSMSRRSGKPDGACGMT